MVYLQFFLYDNGQKRRSPATLDKPSCFDGKCVKSFWAEVLVVAKLLKEAGLGDWEFAA